MAVNTFKTPLNCSSRAKEILASLVEESLDSLHLETLLNLPSLINSLQLDDSLTTLLLTNIEARTDMPDQKARLRVSGQNMFMILDGLLANNNGVLHPSTKQQILIGINKH